MQISRHGSAYPSLRNSDLNTDLEPKVDHEHEHGFWNRLIFLGQIVSQMAEPHVLEFFGVCFLGFPSLELCIV